MSHKIVAIALITDRELKLLGPAFQRAYPIHDTPCFGELLAAIDDADRNYWRSQDKIVEPIGVAVITPDR